MIDYSINISNSFLYLGIESLMKDILEDRLLQNTLYIGDYLTNECNVLFIDADYINFLELMNFFANKRERVLIFIMLSNNVCYHFIKLIEAYDFVVFFKNEPISVLKGKIKDKLFLNIKNNKCIEKKWGALLKLRTQHLTSCEIKVINLINLGYSGKNISLILNRSEKTISSHKRSAMKKIGVTSTVRLCKSLISNA